MTDESKLHDQVNRGKNVEKLMETLEDELLTPLENKCWEHFKACDVTDDPMQKTLKVYTMVMKDVRERARALIQQGKDSEKELVRIKGQFEAFKRVV